MRIWLPSSAEVRAGSVEQVATDVTGGNAERTQQSDHEVGEILADPLPGGHDILEMRGGMGGVGRVFPMIMDMVHDREGRLKNVLTVLADVHRKSPNFGVKRDVAAGKQKRRNLFIDPAFEGVQQDSHRLAIGVRRGRLDDHGSLDQQLMVRLWDFEPMDIIVMLVPKMAEP